MFGRFVNRNETRGLAGVLLPSARRSGALRALLLCCFLLTSRPVSAQSGGGHLLDLDGPEARFLELIDLISESEKQLTLLDTFVRQFPRYPAMGTIHAQRQALCVDLKNWDRALEIGSILLELDESDIETVRRNLAAAQGKGDAGLIAKWSDRLKQLEPPEGAVSATSSVRLPFVDYEPAENMDVVDLSTIPQQQHSRVEASLYNRAREEKDPKRKLQLLSLFERQFPASSHLGNVRYMFFLTHMERQDHPKALAAAEAVIERDKSHEDVLFYAAQHYFVTKRSADKVLSLSALLLDLMTTKPRPQHISEEVWEKQKALLIGQSHWMIGSIRMQQERWGDADRSLRLALVPAGSGPDFKQAVLLNLGWANYKLRRIADALKFYEQCVAFGGPVGASAAQSIVSIKAETQPQ